MGARTNVPNKHVYHYHVKRFRSPEKLGTDLLEDRYFTTAKQIKEVYGMPKTAVYMLTHEDSRLKYKRKCYKWNCYTVVRDIYPASATTRLEPLESPHTRTSPPGASDS